MKMLSFMLIFLFFNCINTISQESLNDEEILELYDGLRVADVSDGMDYVGLWNKGLMSTEITAVWKDFEDLGHIFRGIALTVRYVPANDPLPSGLSEEEFNKWVGQTYYKVTPEPFIDSIKKGTALVIDAAGNGEAGIVGSFNSLDWYKRGMVGLVANGAIRDTDEIAKQGIPVYMDWFNRGRGIRPGRNKYESMNQPVSVGGVVVYPGDVIVADGDGVIVVPRAYAKEVALFAQEVLKGDKAGRKSLYKEMGRELDKTVE